MASRPPSRGVLAALGRRNRHGYVLQAPIATNRELDRFADWRQSNLVTQLRGAADRHPVRLDDEVALADAGYVGRRAWAYLGDERALTGRAADLGVLDRYADAATLHAAGLDDLLHHLPRHVDRHGKADADVATTG